MGADDEEGAGTLKDIGKGLLTKMLDDLGIDGDDI